MIKLFFLFSGAFVLFLFSCNDSDKYSDFKVDKSGLRYKSIEESNSKDAVLIGDYVELKLKYSKENDSVLFQSDNFDKIFKMQVNKVSHKGGSFENALMIMNPGDKYQFVISADSFYLNTKQEELPTGVQNGTNLIFDIQLIRKVSAEEIEKEKVLLAMQMKEQQDILIQQYITDNEIVEDPKMSGLYYVEHVKGKGKKATLGDVLTVHYNGKLIDGKLFDSSYKRNEPFSFQLGSGDVILGWEEGFSYMSKGAKAVFVIPSYLAYGKEGFSNLIPSYAPLIFEVELLDIKRK